MKKIISALIIFVCLIAALQANDFVAEQKLVAQRIERISDDDGTLEVLSLNPSLRHGYAVNSTNVFHGFSVLGSAKVSTAAEKKLLMSALASAVRENEGVAAACFNPRHGIRITKGDKVVDIVICFECASARCYGINDGMGFLLTSSASPAFDAFLSRNNIPLAEKKK
jgi:hypothetical protein